MNSCSSYLNSLTMQTHFPSRKDFNTYSIELYILYKIAAFWLTVFSNIEKLRRKFLLIVLRFLFFSVFFLLNQSNLIAEKVYLFKLNNINTWKMCEMCSNLTIKTRQQHHWRSGAFIANRSSHPEVFCKQLFLKISQSLPKKSRTGASFLIY